MLYSMECTMGPESMKVSLVLFSCTYTTVVKMYITILVWIRAWIHIRMSQLGLVVRCSAGKRKDLGSTLRFGSPFSSKLVVYGHCLVTLPCTMNETLTWLTSLPILMRKSLYSIGYKLPLGSYILGFRSLCLSRKWHRTLNWFNELEYVLYIHYMGHTHERGLKLLGPTQVSGQRSGRQSPCPLFVCPTSTDQNVLIF